MARILIVYGTTEGHTASIAERMASVMIEHIDAVRNMDDILKVPGIDVVHIAANDLAQSMGFPAEPEVRAKLMEAIAKARAAGIPAGVGGNDPSNPQAVAELVREGATFVTLSALGLLRLGIDTFRRQYDEAAH